MNRILWQNTLAHVRQQLDECSDSELLERFVSQRDSPAFETLLHRHGPLVWGVCRRVLQDDTDAEDAFQATFFVLVRKAGQLRDRHALSNWLYGVAHTTALKARAMKNKRRTKEEQAAQSVCQTPNADGDWLNVLDDELSRLPDIYRTVLVLCDLKGQSHKEAAELLKCPTGTIGARLARGRRLLADRLQRRGVVLGIGSLATALSHHTTQAVVPRPLLTTTLEAVLGGTPSPMVTALTEKVLQAMLMKKITSLTIVVAVLVSATLGFLPGHDPVHAQTPAIAAKIENDIASKRLEGTWIPDQIVTTNGVTRYPLSGRALHLERGVFVRLEGTYVVANGRYDVADGYLRLAVEERQPWDLEAGESKTSLQYSFHVEGDMLTLCYAIDNKAKAGDLTPGKDRQVVVYKRQLDARAKFTSLPLTPSARPPLSLGSVGGPIPSIPMPKGPTTGAATPAITQGIGSYDPIAPTTRSASVNDLDRARLEKLEQELLELRKKIDAELAKTKAGK